MATSAKKKKIEKDNPETPDIHFIYRPDDNSMFDNACCGQVINVFVLAHYLHQLQPQNAKLYGGGGGVDFYHPESDVVLAAMHAEKFHPSTLPDHIYGASIELLVQPGQQKYYPKERCGIRSKPFNAPTEICFQPIHFKVLYDSSKTGPTRKRKPKKIPRVGQDRVLMFDNTNRLRQAYHISHIRDSGFEEKDFTSTRFQKEYELALIWKDAPKGGKPIPYWRWSKLTRQTIDILIADVLFPHTLPLLTGPLEPLYSDVIHSDLQWNEIVWDLDSVIIRGQRYVLTTMEWKKRGGALGDRDEYIEQDFFPDQELDDDKEEEAENE